jgi:hypothetical protein
VPGPDLPGGIHLPRPGGIPGGGLDFPGLGGGLVQKNEQGTDPPKKPGQDEGPQPGDKQPTGTDEKTDPTDTKIDNQIDKAGLPRGGKEPFIPKLGKNKRGDPILEKATVQRGPKKGKKGYVDTQGRIWIKDRAHAGDPDHWDVQEDSGKTYIRVDLNGNPLS